MGEFFGRVKTGAYIRAAKALVKAERLNRENPRVHAKFDRYEWLSLPVRKPAKSAPAA